MARASVVQLVGEWLGDAFSFDSRLARTIAPLVVKPGFLTQEYLAGRRVGYVRPLRLFVFFSIVMFLILGLTGAKLNFNLSQKGEEVIALGGDGSGDTPAEVADEPAKREALDDPVAIGRRVFDRLPQAMFLLAPVFGLFLWGLQRRRVSHYVPHFVFSLHVHSFWFFVLALSVLIDLPLPAGLEIGGFLVLIANPLYLLLAQRRVYGGGWIGNTLRTLLLLVVQVVAMIVTVVGLVALTVAVG